MHLVNSNGKRTRGMRAHPSITRGRPAHICIYVYISGKIVNNGTQVWHDGDVSPSDAYKRLVFSVAGKVPLKLALNILFIPTASTGARSKRELEMLGASCMLCA